MFQVGENFKNNLRKGLIVTIYKIACKFEKGLFYEMI